ncbi:MAG: TonB-dependent receptor [Bacteroidetes bacterium]|nr:TonB-dependent receptor [Bacteroidota bacterium]
MEIINRWRWFVLVGLIVYVQYSIPLHAQGQVEIRGRVFDKTHNEALPSCNVVLRNLTGELVRGTTTDTDGNYSLTVPGGTYILEASYIGYTSQHRTIQVSTVQPGGFDLSLEETAIPFEQLVITAGGRAEKLSESPANIKVLTAQEIRTRHEQTLFGLFKDVPGLDYYETGFGQQQISSRGHVNEFVTNMLMLIDYRKVRNPSLGHTFPRAADVVQEDIQRAEVMLGPNSAMYGSNAGYGVINLISKDPREHPGQIITLSGGNQDAVKFGGVGNLNVSDKFAAKVGVQYMSARDFPSHNILSLGPATIMDDPDFRVKYQVLNGSLYYYPDEVTRISYSTGFSSSDHLSLTSGGRFQVKGYKNWYHHIRARFDSFFGFGNAFFQAYLTRNSAGETFNLDQSALLTLQGVPKQTSIEMSRSVDESKSYDLEFQHSAVLATGHTITWGAQWTRFRPDTRGTLLDDGPGRPAIRVHEAGGYLNYEVDVTQRLRFTLIGRFDYNDTYDDKFSPKLGASYDAGGHVFRFTYNEAYESPNMVNGFLNIALAPIDIVYGTNRPTIGRGAVKGFTLVDSMGNVRGKVDAIKPTTSKTFEVGYKGTIEKAATIDLTLFIRQDKDFIYGLLPVTNPLVNTFVADAQGMPRNEVTLSYLNLGEARLKGVDLGVRYFVTQSVHLWGTFSYQEYDKFKNIPPAILPIYSNNLPKRRWKLGGLYADWWKPGTSVEVNVRHVDSFFFYHGAVAYLNGQVPDYTVVDASVEVPLEFISFATAKLGVNGKNIFDSKHIEFPSSPLLRRLISAQLSLNL